MIRDGNPTNPRKSNMSVPVDVVGASAASRGSAATTSSRGSWSDRGPSTMCIPSVSTPELTITMRRRYHRGRPPMPRRQPRRT